MAVSVQSPRSARPFVLAAKLDTDETIPTLEHASMVALGGATVNLLKLSGENLTVQTRATDRELRRSIGHHRSRQAERRTCSTRTDADMSTLESKLSAELPSFSSMAGTGFAVVRENQADQLATESHASAPPKLSGRTVLRHDSPDARRRGHFSSGVRR